MTVSVQTSGEIGERASVTIICDYSDALIASNTQWRIGDANEDWVSKAGAIRTHSEPFFSRDCAVEAG